MNYSKDNRLQVNAQLWHWTNGIRQIIRVIGTHCYTVKLISNYWATRPRVPCTPPFTDSSLNPLNLLHSSNNTSPDFSQPLLFPIPLSLHFMWLSAASVLLRSRNLWHLCARNWLQEITGRKACDGCWLVSRFPCIDNMNHWMLLRPNTDFF